MYNIKYKHYQSYPEYAERELSTDYTRVDAAKLNVESIDRDSAQTTCGIAFSLASSLHA